MIDLVSKRFIFIIVSLLIIVPGAIAIAMGGLRPGIDFTGGTRWTVIPINEEANSTERFRAALSDAGYTEVLLRGGSIGEAPNITNTITMDLPGQVTGEEKARVEEALIEAELVPGVLVTETAALTEQPAEATPGAATPTVELTATGTITPEATITGTAAISPTETITATPGTTLPPQNVVTRMRIPESHIVDFLAIGPTIGRELLQRAFIAIGMASAAILLYLTIVFRKVPNAFRYGVCAIIALLHDVLLVMGIFAILGLLIGIEIDALFVTAMLTVIGFSVHDSIVVFDRIRENILKRRFERFADVVNYSLVQTLARSINTSVTTVLTLFAIYLFGGASIRNFVLALLIGIISGTYSSIFNASMLLVIWENREWFGRRKEATT